MVATTLFSLSGKLYKGVFTLQKFLHHHSSLHHFNHRILQASTSSINTLLYQICQSPTPYQKSKPNNDPFTMHASIMNILALAALVLQATANIITFNNLGSDTLTLCFVANAGEYTPGQSSLYVFFCRQLAIIPPGEAMKSSGIYNHQRYLLYFFLVKACY
jgi:hypothetical protein